MTTPMGQLNLLAYDNSSSEESDDIAYTFSVNTTGKMKPHRS